MVLAKSPRCPGRGLDVTRKSLAEHVPLDVGDEQRVADFDVVVLADVCAADVAQFRHGERLFSEQVRGQMVVVHLLGQNRQRSEGLEPM